MSVAHLKTPTNLPPTTRTVAVDCIRIRSRLQEQFHLGFQRKPSCSCGIFQRFFFAVSHIVGPKNK